MWPNVFGHLNITPIYGFPSNCCHKVGRAQMTTMSLYGVALQLTFSKGLEHNASSMKTVFAKGGVEELRWPAQNPD